MRKVLSKYDPFDGMNFHAQNHFTCNYRRPHGLILGVSIKAHLFNLGSTTLDHLNYPSLGMAISS
jgi:hypothetical protein